MKNAILNPPVRRRVNPETFHKNNLPPELEKGFQNLRIMLGGWSDGEGWYSRHGAVDIAVRRIYSPTTS
jgi:hypothetical protein